jgi:hypothetical protein
MAVTLKTHTDIASALRTLGLGADALTPKGLEALQPETSKDPELVRALRTLSPDLLKAAHKTLSSSSSNAEAAKAASTSAPKASGVGGAGVMPFAVANKLPTKHGGSEPRLNSNTPKVAAFLQLYGAGKVSRPVERMLVHAAKIQEVLMGETNVEKLIDHVMSADLRRHVFLLEGITKFYGHRTDSLDKPFAQAKELEDSLGLYSAVKSNLAYAQKVNAPAPVLEHMQHLVDKAHKALGKLLEDEWMPSEKNGKCKALATLVEKLGNASWDDYRDDKKYIASEFAGRVSEVDNTHYDMTQLQTGIHELRRQLRWFPIYAEALNGLVQLDATQNPIAAYQPLLDKPLATSKYVDLPDAAREVDPILIPKSLYLAVMQLTLDLGAIKDAGEPLEALAEAYVDVGLAKSPGAAHKDVLALVGNAKVEDDLHAQAQGFYDTMKENDLLKAFRDAVSA